MHVKESYFGSMANYDVVVHWRKWFPEFYRPEAINVINCQDHSFNHEWQSSAKSAYERKQLSGILCFPTWHKRNLLSECPWLNPKDAVDGLTLGVDTDIYRPVSNKDGTKLLWASDPGRGLQQALQLFAQIRSLDRCYTLHVCAPDYSPLRSVNDIPGVRWHGNMSNGPELWNLFNECGVLLYPSTFNEPSSRAHRQSQAAGSIVFYPPGRGRPSELIEHMKTGVVSDPSTWARTLLSMPITTKANIQQASRALAVSESWDVQASRFSRYFSARLNERG
jgi:glycosyltransferase involved in cell wall biosynthesis